MIVDVVAEQIHHRHNWGGCQWKMRKRWRREQEGIGKSVHTTPPVDWRGPHPSSPSNGEQDKEALSMMQWNGGESFGGSMSSPLAFLGFRLAKA